MNVFRWCSAVLVALASSMAWAETFSIGSVPGNPRKAGFSMSVSLESLGSHGYHPVYLKFTPIGNQFTRDRMIDVMIGPRNDYESDLDYDFRTQVKLSQGSASVEVPILLPQYYRWNRVEVHLFEDGREINNSRVSFGINNIYNRFAGQKCSVGVMTPRDETNQDQPWKKFPDLRIVSMALGDGPVPKANLPRPLSHSEAKQYVTRAQDSWVQFRLVEEHRLHDTWLAYSELDVILVSEPLLARVESEQPSKMQAIRKWVAAGGNLWIYSAANRTSQLLAEVSTSNPPTASLIPPGKINNNLRLGERNDDSPITYESWSGYQKESQRYSYQQRYQDMPSRQTAFDALVKNQHPIVATAPTSQISQQIEVGSYGAGSVTVFNDIPFPGNMQFWFSVTQRIHGSSQLNWVSRNGIDVGSGNDNYWAWLIGSVGRPPVLMFVLLNTLFVITVGPFCYFLFRRRGRLYLLYFFAPFLAFLVTCALFSYALVADGIGTKARVRQITWLDLKNDTGYEHSRHTYYAVFGSEDGLQFPDDTAVYPVRNQPSIDRYYYRRRGGRDGAIGLADGNYRYSGSFLPTRDQVQMLVNRPIEIDKTLSFDLTAQSPQVTNYFSYPLRTIVVSDFGGKYWIANNVKAGETVSCEAAGQNILDQILESDAIPKLGEVPMLRRNQYYGGNVSPGMNVSVLEEKLKRWSEGMPYQSFVAIADVEEDQLGVNDAKMINSVHVLMGELP